MTAIWDDQNRYLVWLEVELAVCEELARMKLIPEKEWRELKKSCAQLVKEGGVDPARVEAIENITRHDVIAFTTAVAEKVGPTSRYIHFGLTSSDVVDTSLSLLIQRAGEILVEDCRILIRILKEKAEKYQDLPTIGRSHGIFAEPTSFGLKFLGWYTEWKRNLSRLEVALEDMKVGKLSGAVGVNAHWDPGFEERVLERLGLRREPVSTQVIPRDRHCALLNAFAVCAGSMERIAVELRHLQRSEVAEVMEGFRKGQKGSSAMPHKRNPISSENLTGCARLLRSYAHAGMENVALWHERDISHSSVERIAFPDSTHLLHYALRRLSQVLENLVVDSGRVRDNLKKAGPTVFSGHFLLELVKQGASREQAYQWVQQCALGSLEGKGDFLDLMCSHQEITSLIPSKKLRYLGSLNHQLKNVPKIYKQALKNPSSDRSGATSKKSIKSRKKPKRTR